MKRACVCEHACAKLCSVTILMYQANDCTRYFLWEDVTRTPRKNHEYKLILYVCYLSLNVLYGTLDDMFNPLIWFYIECWY